MIETTALTYNMRQTFAFTLHNDNSQSKRLLADKVNMQLFSPRQCLCLSITVRVPDECFSVLLSLVLMKDK